MPTLNEAFATSFRETKTPPAANSLDAAFDTTFNDDETKLRANLHTAVRTDPVKIARADTLAKETGLPTDMVARNLVNVELQRAVEKADNTLRTDPALLTKFKESDLFAKKARDDIDALVNVHGELKAWKGPDANFTNVVKGLAASLPQGLEIVRQGMGAQMGDFLEWAGLIERDDVYKKDRMRKMNQALGAGDFTRPDIESGTLRAVYGGAESTLRMLPGLAASVITRNPTYALASAGLQSQGEAYAKYRGRGGAPLESFIGATGEGAVEVITEKLPTEFLTAAMGKKGFGEFLTGLLAREVPTEQLATILQDAIDTAVANPDKTWSQYLAERPEAAYSTFISTVTQSALMGGAAVAVNRLSGQADKIAEAEANARQLQKVLAATAQVKMREHSAGDFSQAMQSIAESEEGTRSSVFIDGEVLAQSVTIEELARVLPSAISQLEAAAATNGIVELPIGEVLANVQGTPLEQVLLQNARATPDAMSLVEAEDAVKLGGRWVEEAETLMQQAQDQDTIRASSEVVRKAVLEQLNTAGAVARRYRPSVNDALARVTAALFTTQAQRMNMTPEQLFVDSGFAVRGRGQGPTTGGRVLNAGGKTTIYHGTTPEAAAAIERDGFDVSRSADGTIWFTSNQDIGEVAATGSGAVVARAFDEANLKLGGWAESDKFSTDELIAQGYDGLKLEDDGETTYQIFKPEKLEKVTDNLEQSATIRRGTETLKKYGLKPGKSYKTREVAAALEARQRAKYGTIAADDRSPEALAQISKWMQAEVEFAMDNPESSGVGWYSEKFQRALDTMAQQFPELATDKVARDTMTALIAITSDGQKVVPNFAQAMDIYGNFKATGKFTTTRGTQRQASVDGNLAVVQRLHDMMGPEAMHEYLMQEKTISELKKLAKANGGDLKSDYQAHIKMPMAAVEFGPKLGAFYANLMGAHGYLTMDRWWSRSFNRYRGTLLQAPTRQGLDRFKELLGNPALSDDEAIAATVEPRNAYEAKGFKNGTELEKAANTIYKAAFENLEDSPFNATDRTFMLDAVNKAQKSLSRKGYNLSVADIQAILWYYEKRLYGELGARQTADISYEEAAQRVVAGYAGGQGIESLLDGTAATPENGGADQGRVPVGEEPFNAGDVNGRLEQAGDGTGRRTSGSLAPLEGAPAVPGFNGPDPRVVAVAERYAADNGIELKRQSEYVQVDPERAARIAAAYEAMPHSPQDPAVREAYENLIAQTLAQYRALEAAGYKFWFMDLSREDNQAYASSPWNAMRDMRANQQMGVFPTTDGFGTSAEFNPENNLLFADTGLQWPVGSVDGELKPVLANDLFRAVHDAFGHGLEGAGFRAQGEENAWQAHARLFTGSAVAAITTETRGQNSWLNFGPYGEQNQTAQVEDTVFADQKTGLLPEWTWNEGRAGDMQTDVLEQGPRGTYSPRNFEIVLNENANLSTYFHELSHFYLDFLGRMAEMPGASPEVVEDFNTFLQWAKVTPEQWREWRDFVVANPNKPLPKGMVKVHESLASAGEQYFLEGKAPSLELQPFMRRFARWMESVYRSLQQFIAGNPNKELQLNADIRRFFDRALATDEEIAQAEQAAGMLPDDDATAEAKERLNKRSMGDFKWSVRMRDGFIADLRKQAKEIRDSIRQTVTEEVDAMPAMQAKDALDRLMAASPEYKAELKAWKDAREAELARATEAVKAQLVAAEEAKTNAPLEGLAKGRFLSKNRAEVENKAEAAALEWEKQNPKPRRITPDMTPQMESIADKYGYASVDQMLIDIDVTGSRRELIDGMTEQRMLEDHGDLIDERAIQQAANEAVHNDARARSLATELRTQQEMLGERADTGRTARNGRKITTNILLAAARNFASNVVGRAKILDLGNLAWKHNSAEARAGKRWQQLTSQGKTVEAVKAKQDQVLNNAAAKAAQEAQAEMRKLLDYVNKFDKDSVRAKLPASYLDQIDKLLERVDLRVSTTRRDIDKRAALSKWIESQHALGLDPIVPDYLLDDAQLTSYKEMTVDQFREFADTIKNIEHLGRLKSKLLAAKDKREFDIIVDEIVQEIVANKGTPLPVQLEPDGRIKKFFKGAWADHRKLNSLVRQMDGGKDNGPLYRALVRSMNEAGTKENVMLEQATEAMAKIYAPIENLPGGFSGASVYIPEINASLSRAGRLAIALNWGNSTNRQRVMGGDNWTQGQVEAILATLSTTELEFVNNVWAQLDSYWPEMKAKQERVSGVVEDKVEAEPFELTAADGTIVQMRGGYYPIKYDSDRSLKSQKNEAQEVAADMLRGAILRPSTRRGHLKARVDEVNRPVRKDLSVITQHVNQVVHDLAWHEWLIDATRLLNDPRIAGSIRDYYGAETHRAMTDSMRAIAEGDIAHQTEIDKLLLLMRSNATRSIMGASLTTALLQPFGLTQSMARIGVVPVLKGAWRWAGEGAQMQNSMKWIGEKSDFMRLRSKTFNRELREISQRVQGKSKFMQVADASLFFLMQKLQMVADVPTWIGAYEKALAGGVDDATAVQLADEAVLGSQGGGNTKDLAGVQRNLPFLTQFYSYFSTTLQLVAEKTALTDFKNPRAVAGWMGDMALLAVIPAILPALITYLLKGGGEDDEPEDWAKRLAEWQASYLLGMFVGLRELPAVWSPFDYQGPPAGKLINDGKRLVQQAGQGEIDDQAVLATIGFLGTALGIPTTQLVRSYKGWLAWDEGDAPPTSILFGPPPKD